jgi:Bacterial SH3 domain
MNPKTALRGMALFSGCWFIVMLTGCSGPQVQETESNGQHAFSSQPSDIGAKQLDPLLVRISQLQVATLEAVDAARIVGTAENQLTDALQHLASAEHLVQAGRMSYIGKQYRESLEHLRAADMAFRQAEEAAVRAGLEQLERELVADYGRLLPSQDRNRRPASGAVRVSQLTINLRDGAGLTFPVVGKAQRGDTLNLLAESGEWYRVQTAAGLLGWVSKSLVTRLPEP